MTASRLLVERQPTPLNWVPLTEDEFPKLPAVRGKSNNNSRARGQTEDDITLLEKQTSSADINKKQPRVPASAPRNTGQ
jgi:hypothetical protein